MKIKSTQYNWYFLTQHGGVTVTIAAHWTSVQIQELEQAVCQRVTIAGRHSQFLKLRLEPRRHYRQSVKHVRPSFITLSGVLFQLRQLRQVRSSLTSHTIKTLVHAFISSRLDYSNSLLYGADDGLLKKLQAVQNAAARVTTETRKFDHITPVLRELHWLPVRKRIVYKLAVMVYKCLHGMAPWYLADDCVPVTSIASRRYISALLCPVASLSLVNLLIGLQILSLHLEFYSSSRIGTKDKLDVYI